MEALLSMDVVSFIEPERLWLLLVIVPCILFFFIRKCYVSQRVLTDPWFALYMPGSRMPSVGSYIRKCVAAVLVSVLLVFAWAQPEKVILDKKPIYGRVRITFILDISPSMVYAEDLKPNRLVVAKQVIEEITNDLWYDPELSGVYSLSLIPFAGAGMPLYTSFTTNKEGFIKFVQAVDVRTITTAGTNIYAALDSYRELLEKYPAEDDKTINLAIFISDGGKDEGVVHDRALIKETIKALPPRTVINTIGIGSKKLDEKCLTQRKLRFGVVYDNDRDICSSVISVQLIERDESGNVKDFLRENPNDQDSPVLESLLDEEILEDIAGRLGGNGTYTFFSSREKFFSAFKQTILSERILVGYSRGAQLEPASLWFLIPAFLIIYIAFGNAHLILRRAKNIFLPKTPREKKAAR